MPTASPIPQEATVTPRDYLCPAHSGVDSNYPVFIGFEGYANMFWRIPNDWNGFAKIRLWFLGYDTDTDIDVRVIINAGTCGEPYNTHTETHDYALNMTADSYTCLDILLDFATVLALLNVNDMIEITVNNIDAALSVLLIGAEILEL